MTIMQDQKYGPDFSHIDSKEKAEEFVRKGVLEKCFLLPLEFGGKDIDQNTVYVPLGFAKVKSDIDKNIIAPLVMDKSISQYEAFPNYQGSSFVPMSIQINASNPGSFSTKINIWGEAIN
jgi:hypothetical protein